MDGERTGFTFSSYINPEEPFEISPFAFECHMITKTKLLAYPSTEKILTNFLKFVDGCTLVAHNAAFDIRMLNQEMNKYNLETHASHKYFCTMKYFKQKVPGVASSLDAATKHFVRLLNRFKINDIAGCQTVFQTYNSRSCRGY